MGVLYRGRDPVLDREVAIKVMAGDFSTDESARSRFFREARASARLQHRNIVTIFEFAEDAGTPYIAMEFLRGQSLSQRLRIAAAADARAEARHRHAVAHRPALRARTGHHPPRRQAGQRLAARRRHGEAAGFRHRQDRRVDDDQRGKRARQRVLHGARAGGGTGSRWTRGRVCGRRRALRAAQPAPAVRGGDADGRDDEDRQRGPAAAGQVLPRPAAGADCRGDEGAAARAAAPVPARRRLRRRAQAGAPVGRTRRRDAGHRVAGPGADDLHSADARHWRDAATVGDRRGATARRRPGRHGVDGVGAGDVAADGDGPEPDVHVAADCRRRDRGRGAGRRAHRPRRQVRVAAIATAAAGGTGARRRPRRRRQPRRQRPPRPV